MLKIIALIIVSLVFLDTIQMLTRAWVEVSVAKSVKIYKFCLGDEREECKECQ